MLRTLLALVAVLWAAATPAPALAHTGPLTLAIDGDGATGVTITAIHADGHPVDARIPIQLTATGPVGRTVGPVELLPAGEGVGFYNSGPILTPGQWQVTVVSAAPSPGRAEATVHARPGTPTITAPPQAAPSSAAVSTPTALWWALGITLLTALAGLLALRHRRRT